MNWFFDGFSGMGGVSLGIERAGCRVAVAVNHDDRAIKAHAANHPYTAHLNGDIRNVNIRKLAGRLIQQIGIDEAPVWLMGAVYPTIWSQDGSVPLPIQAQILYNGNNHVHLKDKD